MFDLKFNLAEFNIGLAAKRVDEQSQGYIKNLGR